MRGRPWAPWKVALAVLVIVSVVGIAIGVIAIDARARDVDRQLDEYGRGLGSLALGATIAAFAIQWRRVKKHEVARQGDRDA
jgi:hypothetical protein